MNYPNQDDYETEEEYNQALEWYWMEVDRQYDMMIYLLSQKK